MSSDIGLDQLLIKKAKKYSTRQNIFGESVRSAIPKCCVLLAEPGILELMGAVLLTILHA